MVTRFAEYSRDGRVDQLTVQHGFLTWVRLGSRWVTVGLEQSPTVTG